MSDSPSKEFDVGSIDASSKQDGGISSSTTTEDFHSSEEQRDEVKEILKMTQKDTKRVIFWRFACTAALAVTAFAVTFTTYRFLKAEEKKNFETAFKQFSRTIADAALAQQEGISDGFKSIATIMSAYSSTNNVTWPFLSIPKFEHYAENVRKQAGMEILTYFPKVEADLKDAYLEYVSENYQATVKEGHITQTGSLDRLVDPGNKSYHPYISTPTLEGEMVPDKERDTYWPMWEFSPPPATYGFINWNLASVPDYANAIPALLSLRDSVVVTRVRKYISVPTAMSYEAHAEMHSKLAESSVDYPHSFAAYPVLKDVDDKNSDIVALVGGAYAWDQALNALLPSGVKGIHAIISNDCNQTYTYVINGVDALFRGEGDMHEQQFDHMRVSLSLAIYNNPNITSTPGHCMFTMDLYPTAVFKSAYDGNTPEIFAAVVAVTFGLVALVFLMYDWKVQTRNQKLIIQAARTSAVVSEMFPENMRERVMQQAPLTTKKKGNLKAFLNDGKDGALDPEKSSKPLADLFLETTVIFADIVGFTAWSSVREPAQVFMLLETLYQEFDKIAKRRRVYKVETVGDCYVAVTGLPEPVRDGGHAVIMARFANDIRDKMQVLTKELEVLLGPDTEELALRIGMHSGPVTGGVLRGERGRFQLFGDTMNTTASLESSSQKNKIQVSKETAEILMTNGKSSWLEKRADRINAKGKGILETYWLNTGSNRARSVASGCSSSDIDKAAHVGSKSQRSSVEARARRLINWNVETLLRLLRQIVAHREAKGLEPTSFKGSTAGDPDRMIRKAATPLEEVEEIISLPKFNAKAAKKQKDPDSVEIPEVVVEELRSFVTAIAAMYRNNPFHNFDHASHVVMSVVKLMSRIVAPSHIDIDFEGADERKIKKAYATLHDHTYGITSDPLTQFACAFSALIHDVDHVGVSNAQLVKEGVDIAAKYKERSMAEQNSLDLSWDLLMRPEYKSLQSLLFPTQSELIRFRKLVVNSVMATDIVDKDLKILRNIRWEKAFKKGVESTIEEHAAGAGTDVVAVEEDPRDENNRKATIVIEHIIQASDVSHTMQHWHVYKKWNQNLFEELYVAYLNGRMEKNPADFWYKGEFGFFDFYIIPLTKKLKECGVFGVSSDEYLNYAVKNREEWEARGEEMVEQFIEIAKKKYGVKGPDGKIIRVTEKT